MKRARNISEALEQCYDLIFELAGGDIDKISAACKKLDLFDPWNTPEEKLAELDEYKAAADELRFARLKER